MTDERERKIDKILQQLRKELEEEKAFDESFYGDLVFNFKIKSGGIVGNIRIEKELKLVAV